MYSDLNDYGLRCALTLVPAPGQSFFAGLCALGRRLAAVKGTLSGLFANEEGGGELYYVDGHIAKAVAEEAAAIL